MQSADWWLQAKLSIFEENREDKRMYKKETTVINEHGLHARPAGVFVKEASRFPCNITVTKLENGKSASAKSIIRLIGLQLSSGCKIELAAEGESEMEAVEALVEILANGCGE